MALLTPHEILKQLGFNVPEEGLQINSSDAFLHSQLFALLGQTMRLDAISEEELLHFAQTIHNMGSVMSNREAGNFDKEDLPKFKGLLKALAKAHGLQL